MTCLLPGREEVIGHLDRGGKITETKQAEPEATAEKWRSVALGRAIGLFRGIRHRPITSHHGNNRVADELLQDCLKGQPKADSLSKQG